MLPKTLIFFSWLQGRRCRAARVRSRREFQARRSSKSRKLAETFRQQVAEEPFRQQVADRDAGLLATAPHLPTDGGNGVVGVADREAELVIYLSQTVSFTHLVVLVLAAPANFRSAALASHAVCCSPSNDLFESR
jgi:hypothetical protein